MKKKTAEFVCVYDIIRIEYLRCVYCDSASKGMKKRKREEAKKKHTALHSTHSIVAPRHTLTTTDEETNNFTWYIIIEWSNLIRVKYGKPVSNRSFSRQPQHQQYQTFSIQSLQIWERKRNTIAAPTALWLNYSCALIHSARHYKKIHIIASGFFK